MPNRYTVLINRASNQVMVLDNFKVRYNRMRKRIAEWVKLLSAVPDFKYVMVTLTYAPEYDWEPNHIRQFMLSLRKVLGKKLLAYAWVAELQKRGVIHYHVMLVVPNDLVLGDDLPYPDEAGLWPYGFTRLEIARTPFYLITYLGKEYQKDFTKFPKGIRVFAVHIHDAELKQSLRYQSLRAYQQEFVDKFGWSELKALLRIRREIGDTEGISWEIWSFESDKEDAINKAKGWEELGHSWSGRNMFLGVDNE
jgi:hypothetical protein